VRFAFALTRGDGEVADKRIRTAAMNTLVGPSVTSRVFLQVRPPEQSGWILGATIAGSAILSFVCILSVLDTAIRLGQRRFQLAKLSLSPRQFRSLKIQTFLLPLLLVCFLGMWLGLWLSSVVAAVFNTALPIAQLVLVAIYAVGLSVLATLGVALFSND
jgi:polyferredoxin